MHKAKLIMLTLLSSVMVIGLVSTGSAADAAPESISAQTTAAATQLAKTAPPAGTTKRVEVKTSAQLQAAIKAATPGTAIMLHAGTYTGPFDLLKSGTAKAPISMQPYGNGKVTLTAKLAMPACNATGPDINRTVRFRMAASYWVIQGLTIDGGVYIPGKGVQQAYNWMQKSINNKDWATLRAVPGRGTNDPTAAKNAISYVAKKAGTTLTPIDGVQILNNKITGKGIHVTLSRYGVIKNNTISNIACGVGPGIWFGTYSDGWTVSGNTIDTIKPSTKKHYMHEGIRVDNGSNYNVISGNTVKNLSGDGRAFTTDQTASYNTFTRNTATNVNIGFNDQMGGWGNKWTYNTVTKYREAGISFRMMDAPLKAPSKASSTYDSLVACNTLSGTGAGIQVGAMSGSEIRDNKSPSIKFGPNVSSYWVAEKNKFDGANKLPALGKATTIRAGKC